MIIKKYILIGSSCIGLAVSGMHYTTRAWLDLENYAYNIYQESKLKKYISLIENDGKEISIDEIITKASLKYSIREEIIKGLMQHESSNRADAYSPKGAIGLMQIMPFNAKRCGVKPHELWQEEKNIMCGTQILSEELKTYKGNLEKALRAYNGGHKCVINSCKESINHSLQTAKNIAQNLIK